MTAVDTTSRWGTWTPCVSSSGFGLCVTGDAGDGTPVVRIEGELDLATAGLVEDGLTLAASLGANDQVIVDVSCLRFADAAGLRPIADADRELRATGWSGVRIRGARGIVRRVIELTGLAELLAEPTGRDQVPPASVDERHRIDAMRVELGLSVTELFVGYFALGGSATRSAFAAHLSGDGPPLEGREQDLALLALNEVWLERGHSTPRGTSPATGRGRMPGSE